MSSKHVPSPSAETAAYIESHRHDDVGKLALQFKHDAGVDLTYALQQIEGWQRMSAKVPQWAATEGIVFPTRLAIEQCSGSAAAQYKRRVIAAAVASRSEMADVTGGAGVDFWAIAPLFGKATYVERDESLCLAARHNMEILGLRNAKFVCMEAEQFVESMGRADLVFIDPARRDAHGGKVVSLGDCSPDVTRLMPQLRKKAATVALKLSPMLDISSLLRDVAGIKSVHVVEAGGECKELFALVDWETSGEPLIVCAQADSPQDKAFSFHPQEERTAPQPTAAQPQQFLYLPSPAVMKAAPFKLLAARFGLSALHPNSHLFTSEKPQAGFPGKVFCIDGWSGFGKKELRQLLAGCDRANVAVRNFPSSVAELRKRLRLADGGTVFVFATTLADGSKALLRCRKADV